MKCLLKKIEFICEKQAYSVSGSDNTTVKELMDTALITDRKILKLEGKKCKLGVIPAMRDASKFLKFVYRSMYFYLFFISNVKLDVKFFPCQ